MRERMLEQIQRKVDGQEITAEPQQEPETQIIDLMAALKASLAKGGAASSPAPERAAGRSAAKQETAESKGAKVKPLKRKAG